jgi:hypothetical protein
MAKISKIFSYNLADDYLAQTNDLQKTALWTYNGPDKVWVFIDNETKKLFNTTYYTAEMNGADIPTPEGTTKLEINCANNGLIGTLLGACDPIDGSTLPQFSETLPNGEIYERPMSPMPDHTYEINDATYDFNTDEWTLPWKQTWVTWEQLISRRDGLLTDVTIEMRNVRDLPESIQTLFDAYKLELENLETNWEGYPAYKVWIPVHPING